MSIHLLIRRLPILNPNLLKLYFIDSLQDDQKVVVPLTVCCLNVQSLRNKAIPMADYVVSQD